MTAVIYKGTSDVRILAAADLPGVEFKKTSFEQGVAQEVSSEAAQLLIENPDRFGLFEAEPSNEPALFDIASVKPAPRK